MTDALRNQYLQKLGIVQYVSKDLPLVAAAPAMLDGTELDGTEIVGQPVASETNTSDLQKKSMAELSNGVLNGINPSFRACEKIASCHSHGVNAS